MDVLERVEEQMKQNSKIAGYLRHIADLVDVSDNVVICPINPWIVRHEGEVSFEMNIQISLPHGLYEKQQDKAITRIIEKGPDDDNSGIRKDILGRKRNIE